ncbi:hypothetical protein [Ruminococcus sp.]
MYSIVRMILVIVLVFIIFKVIHIKTKKKVLMISLFGLVFYIAIMCTPIENLFISFDTPTEALSYYDPFVGKVIDTVEGNETCMIITQKDVNESGVSYVKKSVDGYKVLSPIHFPYSVKSKLDGHGSIKIFRVFGTSDYYLDGNCISDFGTINKVSDSLNSDIKVILVYDFNKNNVNLKDYLIFGYLNNYENSYSLMIDNTVIELE